jgi:hypothetical protein
MTLARHRPLRTLTPLRRGKPPTRRAPLAPVSAKRRARRVQQAGVRVIVWLRADRGCEGCGIGLAIWQMEPSHRRAASQGGSYTPSNICCLCASCHRTGRNAVHRRPKGEALRRGLRLLRHEDPASTPVELWDGRRVRLDDRGGYEPVEEAA